MKVVLSREEVERAVVEFVCNSGILTTADKTKLRVVWGLDPANLDETGEAEVWVDE